MKDKETIKKVFELVIKTLKHEQAHYHHLNGICIQLTLLRNFSKEITRNEFDIAYTYFLHNKPKSKFFGLIHSKWQLSEYWTGNGHWWTQDINGHNERIKFLQHLIKKAYK